MRSRASLPVGLLLALTGPALVAQVDTELDRIRDLVRAGALPRNALAEAESRRLERGYQETLRRTLLSETLEPTEIKAMLDAAKGHPNAGDERWEYLVHSHELQRRAHVRSGRRSIPCDGQTSVP